MAVLAVAAGVAVAAAPAVVPADAETVDTAAGADGPPTPSIAPSSGASTAGSAPDDAAAATASAATPAAGAAGSAPSTTTSTDGPTVVERAVYRRAPDDAGRLEAELHYELPREIDRLEFRIERPDVEVVAVEGFERVEDSRFDWPTPTEGPLFRWDRETADPHVVVRHDVNDAERAYYAGGTDEWAIAVRPTTRARWRYSGSAPAFAYEATVDGEGVAGDRMVYLGPSETYETTVRGERIRLVVPEAADLATPPERILDSLADASDRLRVGERNEEVVAIAAPTLEVDWATRGLSVGPDLRVDDDARVADRIDVWVHEYVHTRQDRSATTAETRWLHEATADYYAATLPVERGHVDFATYRDVLERGATGAAAATVLSEPGEWATGGQYTNGALVVAAIDRRIRLATDGEATFQDVFRAWNEAERFDGDDFERAVARAGGADVGAFAADLATTEGVPATWDRANHSAAFGVDLPEIAVGDPALSVVGGGPTATPGPSDGSGEAPGPTPTDAGRATGDGSLTLLAGETVRATVPVENRGDAPGRYRIRLLVDGASRAVATGELAPGESRTVTLEYPLERSGEREVAVWTERERTAHEVAVRDWSTLEGAGVALARP